MTDDDSYPAEWLHEPPHPDDPRLGENLDPWRPSAAEGARVCEVLHQYVSGSHTFTTALLNLAGDCYRGKTVPEILLAFCEVFRLTAVGSQGQELTLARLDGDLEYAREVALKEAQ